MRPSRFTPLRIVITVGCAGLLADITAVISTAGCNIHNLESRPDRLNAQIDANLEIHDRRQLEAILTSIRRVAGVYGVERVYQT